MASAQGPTGTDGANGTVDRSAGFEPLPYQSTKSDLPAAQTGVTVGRANAVTRAAIRATRRSIIGHLARFGADHRSATRLFRKRKYRGITRFAQGGRAGFERAVKSFTNCGDHALTCLFRCLFRNLPSDF